MTRYVVSPDAAFAALPDGGVVLHLRTKRYFSLNETGAAIWSLLESSASPEEIVERLARAYEVEAAAATRSVERLVAELAREELVTVETSP